MATAAPDEMEADEGQMKARREASIGVRVIAALGDPGGRRTLQVRPLWGNYYRVNLLLENAVGAVRIADSFFLEADGAGNILTAVPEITRRYGPGSGPLNRPTDQEA